MPVNAPRIGAKTKAKAKAKAKPAGGNWSFSSARRIMDYTQAKCLMLSFLCALSAARAEGEIIFRIDPLGKPQLVKSNPIKSNHMLIKHPCAI